MRLSIQDEWLKGQWSAGAKWWFGGSSSPRRKVLKYMVERYRYRMKRMQSPPRIIISLSFPGLPPLVGATAADNLRPKMR